MRGDLVTLRGAGGNFTPAINACVANDLSATSLKLTDTVAVGRANFDLVRGVNCGGHGTYKSAGLARRADQRFTQRVPVGQLVDAAELRAWWAHRQGLDGSLQGKSPAEVLQRSGWARSAGGVGPYLTLGAKAVQAGFLRPVGVVL